MSGTNYLAQNYLGNGYSDNTSIVDVDGQKGNFWTSFAGMLPGLIGNTLGGVAAIQNANANKAAANNQSSINWQLRNQLGLNTSNTQPRNQMPWAMIIGAVVLVIVLVMLLRR